jgi:AcrR family transcriptional regulator
MTATRASRRLSRAESKARTRGDLVDAAERLFTSSGFHATSLDQVAGEAGYTKGAVYSNFDSKEDLFFAVYERRVERALEAFAPLAGEHGDDVPARLARATLQRREAGWIAVFMEFWAHVVRHPELRERFDALHRRGRSVQTQWVRRWQEENGLRPRMSAEAWTTAMFALVTGVALEQLTDPGFDGAEPVEEIFELVMIGMRDNRGEAG